MLLLAIYLFEQKTPTYLKVEKFFVVKNDSKRSVGLEDDDAKRPKFIYCTYACCQGPKLVAKNQTVRTISVVQRNTTFNLNYTFVLLFSLSFLVLVF